MAGFPKLRWLDITHAYVNKQRPLNRASHSHGVRFICSPSEMYLLASYNSQVAMSAFCVGIVSKSSGGSNIFRAFGDSFGQDGQDDLKKCVFGFLRELNARCFFNGKLCDDDEKAPTFSCRNEATAFISEISKV